MTASPPLYRRRYRFVTRIDSEAVQGGTYVWESTTRLPNDSRVEQVRCPVAWFWTTTEVGS